MNSIFRLFLVVILAMAALGWLISEYDHARQALKEGNHTIALKDAQIAKLSQALRAVEEERDDYQSQVDTLTKELLQEQSTIEALERKIVSINISHHEAIRALETEQGQLRSNIQVLETEIHNCEQAFQRTVVNWDSAKTLPVSAGMTDTGKELNGEWVGLTVAGSLGLLALSRLGFVQQLRRPQPHANGALHKQPYGQPLSLRPQRKRHFYGAR